MIKELTLMQPGIYRCIFDRKNINIDSIINLIDTWWTSNINNDFTIGEFIMHFDNFIAHKYIDIQYIRKQIIIKLIEYFLSRNSCNIIDISNSKVKMYVNNTLLKLSPLHDDRNYFYKNYLQGIINNFKMQRCINMTHILNIILFPCNNSYINTLIFIFIKEFINHFYSFK